MVIFHRQSLITFVVIYFLLKRLFVNTVMGVDDDDEDDYEEKAFIFCH